jgi:hypothetical protein
LSFFHFSPEKFFGFLVGLRRGERDLERARSAWVSDFGFASEGAESTSRGGEGDGIIMAVETETVMSLL